MLSGFAIRLLDKLVFESRVPPTAARSRVVHLTSVHAASDARIAKQCQALAEDGYVVTLIAPHDHDEVLNQVQIRALPRRRSRWSRLLLASWRVLRFALREQGDIYHFHDPELIPAAAVLKMFRKKVIYDVHEDYPRAALIKTWISPRLRTSIGYFSDILDRFAMKFVDGVIAATPGIARRFPESKTTLVRNVPLVERFANTSSVPYSEREPLAVYIGIISEARGAFEMLDAIAGVPDEVGARLVLAGTFWPPDLEHALESHPAWGRVSYTGWLSQDDIADLLGRVRVGLVTLHPTPSYLESYPTKLFEYMAASLPVVCSDFPLWRELVGPSESAILVPARDPNAISRAVEKLLRDPETALAMGRRGRTHLERAYSWTKERSHLLAAYERLT